MLTVEGYLGQHSAGHEAELTDEIRENAAETIKRANELCERADFEPVLRSGWRPAAVNSATPGAATHSTHMTGEAVDIADPRRELRDYIAANLDDLVTIGLYTEDPRTTPGWCHLQIKAPASGKFVYIPSADWAARLAKEGNKNA